MKALIEERHRLALRALIGLLLPYENLNLLGEETADRGSTARSKDLDFPGGLPVKAYRHILLGRIPGSCQSSFYQVPYV